MFKNILAILVYVYIYKTKSSFECEVAYFKKTFFFSESVHWYPLSLLC